MDPRTDTNQLNTAEVFGPELYRTLSKIDTQLVSLVLLCLLSVQVLTGVFKSVITDYDMFAYCSDKATVIRLLGYLGLANWLVDTACKASLHHRRIWKWILWKRPWTGLLAAFLLWALLTVSAAQDMKLAFYGGPFRYEGFLSYVAYAGIFLSAALIREDRYRKAIFVTVSAVSALLAGMTLLRERLGATLLLERNGHFGTYSGTFGNSNHYGYYLCVSMIVIAGLFLMAKSVWGKIGAGVCFTLNLIVLLYNSSLGPYLAIAVGLAALFAISWIRSGFRKTWPLLILVALFVAFSFLINNHKVLNDLDLIQQQTGSAIEVLQSGGIATPEGEQIIDSYGSRRGVLWKKTIQVFLEHPVTGVGTDNVQLHIGNSIPHNEYLQIAANNGFPGIALYLAALISCLIASLRNLKKLSDGAVIAGAAVLVYGVSAFVGISLTVATYQLFCFWGLLTGWFKARDDVRMNEEAIAELQAKMEALETPPSEETKE